MLRSDSRFRCGTIAGGLFWREPSACESSHLNDPVAMPFQHSRDCLFAPNRLCAFSIRFSCDGRSELPGRGCREGFWPGTALTNGGGLKKLGVRGAHPGSAFRRRNREEPPRRAAICILNTLDIVATDQIDRFLFPLSSPIDDSYSSSSSGAALISVLRLSL